MSFTEQEKGIISGIIGAYFMGRNISQQLRESFIEVHTHLQSDSLNKHDLRRIKSALEFVTPQSCESCNKEGYRTLIETLMKTNLLLQNAAG